MVYNLISPGGKYPPRPAHVDFRDVAAAHVRAATRDTSSIKDRKRVIFASPHGLVLKDVLELIKTKRPETANRIISSPIPDFGFTKYDLDSEWIEQVTGLKENDFHTLEETFLDTIDDLLKLENEWKEKGFKLPETVPPMSL